MMFGAPTTNRSRGGKKEGDGVKCGEDKISRAFPRSPVNRGNTSVVEAYVKEAVLPEEIETEPMTDQFANFCTNDEEVLRDLFHPSSVISLSVD